MQSKFKVCLLLGLKGEKNKCELMDALKLAGRDNFEKHYPHYLAPEFKESALDFLN